MSYITLPASLVFVTATQAIENIKAIRERAVDKFLAPIIEKSNKKFLFFFPRTPITKESYLEAYKNKTLDSYERIFFSYALYKHTDQMFRSLQLAAAAHILIEASKSPDAAFNITVSDLSIITEFGTLHASKKI
jgi:hypothetical protein